MHHKLRDILLLSVVHNFLDPNLVLIDVVANSGSTPTFCVMAFSSAANFGTAAVTFDIRVAESRTAKFSTTTSWAITMISFAFESTTYSQRFYTSGSLIPGEGEKVLRSYSCRSWKEKR